METPFMSALAATAEVLSPADATAATKSREIAIPAEDGYVLAATLFAPTMQHPGAPFVGIAAGAAIARRFYARFATYLAERGATVLTFDYRAVGGSRRAPVKGSPVRMRDWCLLDVPGVLTWAARTFPNRPLHWVGHSMGGFATASPTTTTWSPASSTSQRSTATGAAWPCRSATACSS
jgi:predicted alpha/beta hydrolase